MEAYLQLFLKTIQTNNSTRSKCVVIAFTSSNSGEGVSYVAESFAIEISKRTGKRVLIADTNDLQNADLRHYRMVSKNCRKTNVPNLFVLEDKISGENESSTPEIQVFNDESGLDRATYNLQTLRFCFDFVLLDCSALSVSSDAAMLASKVDGVVVVVEANRTNKEQVRNVLNTIESAQGNLMGCVLNKRQYSVPNWLYKRL